MVSFAQKGNASYFWLYNWKYIGLLTQGPLDHTTWSQQSIDSYTKIVHPIEVLVANVNKSIAVGQGSICVSKILLKDVLYAYATKLTYNLLSVSKLTKIWIIN